MRIRDLRVHFTKEGTDEHAVVEINSYDTVVTNLQYFSSRELSEYCSDNQTGFLQSFTQKGAKLYVDSFPGT